MYSIYADNILIFSDTEDDGERVLNNPKLKLSDSTAGSLEFTIPITNVGYSIITRMKTVMRVDRDGKEIWEGRPLTEKSDFWNNKTFTCEGELAYLNDTTQPQAEYHNETVRSFLDTLIQIHNTKATVDKQFTVGAVTVEDSNDSIYRYTNNESTLECINDKLVSRLGGHIRIRKADGVRYIDYLKEYPKSAIQEINFGENLLDFAKAFDMSGFATVIYPLGERLEESPIEALEAYTTVESVNDGSPYVVNSSGVALYGWIEKVVHWDDVSEPSNLLRKAQQYLNEVQFDNMKLDVTAVDMHYLIGSYEPIDLLDEIHCVSEPHGLNKWFPVTSINIDLSAPQNTVYKLGTSEKLSLSSASNQAKSDILKKIEALPTRQSILEDAKENSTEIMNMATNGYVTTIIENGRATELVIANHQDILQASKLWRWNLNGLGYSKNGYNGDYGLAITMDGSIVADYITTGTLLADIIRTGILSDALGYNYWNLDTGEFKLSWNTSVDNTTLADKVASTTRAVLNNANAYGLGWKINQNTFSDQNLGECYFHGYSSDGTASDINGWVYWNGEKITIPKGCHINPNDTMPFDTDLYSVFRTSSSAWFDVCWDKSNKQWIANSYTGETPSARSTWTWNDDTDIVLASYRIPSSEGKIYSAQLYTPPKKHTDLAEAAYEYTDRGIASLESQVDAAIQDIQDQLDGVVEQFFQDYEPKPNADYPSQQNYPVNEWQMSEYADHEGDMFLDTTSGTSYRWVNENNTWYWKEIPDSAATQALQLARQAKDTADGKRRVFINTPTPPYDIGDIWMGGAKGDILTCTTAKASGTSFATTDFEKLNRYGEGDALYLETPFEWSQDGLTANFSAIIYQDDADITANYPNSWFEWYLRTENGENRIAIGKTCSVSKSALGYGGTVTCIFTTREEAELTTRSNKALLTKSGLKLTTYVEAEGTQPVSELPYKISSEINLDDYFMGIDSADGYQVSVLDLANRLATGVYDGRYVNADGDTMTGVLALPGLRFNTSFDTSLDLPRSTQTFFGPEHVYDVNNRNIFYSEMSLATDRLYRSYVVRAYDSQGSELGRNGFYLTVYNDGTPAVSFTSNTVRDAWANGLNVVKKAGDTMTGNLTARFSSFDLSQSNNGVSSTQYPTTFCILDNGGRIATRMEGVVGSSGTMAAYWYVRNYNTSGTWVAQKGIQMIMDKSGNLTYSISDVANFRSAIGAVNRAGDTLNASFTLSASDATGRFWKVKNSKHEGSFYVDGSGNLGLWSDTKAKWLIRCDTSGNVNVNNPWRKVAQVQGTNSATYSLSGYTEALLMIWHGTNYLGTCVFPVNAIGSTQYEMYTGGWGNHNTGSNRAGCAKVSNTKLTGVMVRVDNNDVTSSSYFRLYAR